MRYVLAKMEEYRQTITYRIYVTDSLKLSGENKVLTNRYSDLLHPEKKDTRTGDEIARDTIEKLHAMYEDNE